MIKSARQLIDEGEKAIVVFTRGVHLSFVVDDNTTSGDWRVLEHQLEDVHKIIIYWRSSDPIKNEVFVGTFEGHFPHCEHPHLAFNISGLKLRGETRSNWVQFGGRNTHPVFFVKN